MTTISAPDGSVTAKFVSFGATLTELWAKDKNGEARNVVLGYDDNVIIYMSGGWNILTKRACSQNYSPIPDILSSTQSLDGEYSKP